MKANLTIFAFSLFLFFRLTSFLREKKKAKLSQKPSLAGFCHQNFILCKDTSSCELEKNSESFTSRDNCRGRRVTSLNSVPIIFKSIDRMHKWRPKKYSFVFVLIRLTSLVGTDKIQKKCSFRTSLVGLLSTKTKRIFCWPPFMHSVYRLR